MPLWIQVVLALAVLLPAAVFALGKLLFRLYTRPPRMPLEGSPTDYGLEFREADFTADDGIAIRGWLILPPGLRPGERRPAVISLHGYGTNRTDILARSAAVALGGFVVLTFDWRRCGESGGEMSSGGVDEMRDLRAALEFLRSQPEADPERIALYGFSIGGVIALPVAAEDGGIRAIAADSPFTTMWDMASRILRHKLLPPFPFLWLMDREFKKKFGAGLRKVDAVKAAARFSPRPLLLLAGKRDRVVPFDHSRRVYKAAGQTAILHVNPDGGHFDNALPETLEKVVLPFLRKHLNAGSP